MKIPKIYLDTSVINFLYADDAPEKKDITIDFFDNYVVNNVYDTYISPVVIDEINKTTNLNKRNILLTSIKKYNLKVIDITEILPEVERLAKIYMQKDIIPKNKTEDALHIAISTVSEIDILLSWNYKHLANFNKERKIISVNILEGYSNNLRLFTPMEVIYEDE